MMRFPGNWELRNSQESSKITSEKKNKMLLICFQDSLECDGTFFSDFGYGWIYFFEWHPLT